MLWCFVSLNISGHSSAALIIYELHPAKQRHLPLRKPLPPVQRCLPRRQSLSAHPLAPRTHLLIATFSATVSNSEHTPFYDLEDTVHSPGTESVRRLNEHSFEHRPGRHKAIAICL